MIPASRLEAWRQRYVDATRENDPDSQIKALYDCRALLLECFEPLLIVALLATVDRPSPNSPGLRKVQGAPRADLGPRGGTADQDR